MELMFVAAEWIQKSTETANLKRNASNRIARKFIMQMKNDPKKKTLPA